MNPYEKLGVWVSMQDDGIRHAYYRVMKTAHPDRGGSNDEAAAVSSAYAQIESATVRAAYQRKQELMGAVTCSDCDGSGTVSTRVSVPGRRTGQRVALQCRSCGGSGRVVA